MIEHKFIVFKDANLVDAMKLMEENTHGFVVCVSNDFRCDGVLTDGDVRRHLIKNTNFTLNDLVVSDVMNQDFTFSTYNDQQQNVISDKIKFLPVLDKNRRLMKIDLLDGAYWIGDYKISDESDPFIIGEIGNNHNGDIELAKKLVKALKKSGANSAKFQMRDMDVLYAKNSDSSSEDLATQYTKDLLNKFQLTNDQLLYLFDYTRDLGMIPLHTMGRRI